MLDPQSPMLNDRRGRQDAARGFPRPVRFFQLDRGLPTRDEPSSFHTPPRRPSVEELLDVDREYRQKAAAGELPQIAPRRFSPSGDRWLPVLHTQRGSRCYTALFSNIERAHRLGRARDWVVLYRRDDSGEHQYTVITGTHGALRGHRVVAGHERECVSAERRAA